MIEKDRQVCPNCGLTVDNNANFCEECGHKLVTKEKISSVHQHGNGRKKAKENINRNIKIGLAIIFGVICIIFLAGIFTMNQVSYYNTSSDNIISQNQPVNGVYSGNGISFKVPSGYYVTNGSLELVGIQKDVNLGDSSNNYEGMSVLKLGNGNSLNAWVQKYTIGEIISKKSLTIDGVPAYAIQSQNDGNTYFDIFIVKNGIGYQLSFFGNLAERINPTKDPDIQLITDSFKIN